VIPQNAHALTLCAHAGTLTSIRGELGHRKSDVLKMYSEVANIASLKALRPSTLGPVSWS
jgi:hypothetical protein